MKILVFTEGTLLIEPTWVGLTGPEIAAIVKAGKKPRDFWKFIPIGDPMSKLRTWAKQGAELLYLTSRTLDNEVEDIGRVLTTYNFPEGTFLYRKNGEAYKDVAERILPDILIEDDYASDGGVADMTYPHLTPEAQARIFSIVLPEFTGIAQLPDSLAALRTFPR